MPDFKTPFELALAGLLERIAKDATLSADIKEAVLKDFDAAAPQAFQHLKTALKNEPSDDKSKNIKSA